MSTQKEVERCKYLFEENSTFGKFKKAFLFVIIMYSCLIYPVDF